MSFLCLPDLPFLPKLVVILACRRALHAAHPLVASAVRSSVAVCVYVRNTPYHLHAKKSIMVDDNVSDVIKSNPIPEQPSSPPSDSLLDFDDVAATLCHINENSRSVETCACGRCDVKDKTITMQAEAHRATVDFLQRAIHPLEEKIKEQEGANTLVQQNLQNTIDALEAQVDTLRTDLKDERSANDAITFTLTQVKEEMTAKMQTAASEIHRLKLLKKEIESNAASELHTAKLAVMTERARVKELESNSTNDAGRVQDLEDKHASSVKMNATLQVQLTALKEDMAVQKQTAASELHEAKLLVVQEQARVKELESHAAKDAELEKRLAKEQTRATDLALMHDSSEKVNAVLQVRLETSEREVARLKRDLDEAQKTADENHSAMKRHRAALRCYVENDAASDDEDRGEASSTSRPASTSAATPPPSRTLGTLCIGQRGSGSHS